MFQKPENLNGKELRDELNAGGVLISYDYNSVQLTDNGKLFLDIAEKDKEKANTIVAAHNGRTVAIEPTIEDKLASVGLNLTDLKSALGI